MLSDALYTGTLPAAVEKGLTVLLPKEVQPKGWGETRPITLSSTVLKAIAQLLLRRCAYTLQPLNTLQWAAFDSVAQTSLARLVEEKALLETLAHTQQQDRGGDNPLLPPPPHGGSYMDDTYLWGENPLHLQATLDKLQKTLQKHGLKINPKKTRIITNTDNPFKFKIDGQVVTPEGGDAALTVLGSPVSFAGGPQHLAAEMGTRGRKAFGKNKKILTAKTALKRRLNLHTTLVRQSALWGCETLQLQQAWTDWNTRTLRMARVHLHKNNQGRTGHARHATVEGDEVVAPTA
ncbi:unnamed protein product, partial [Symbiodinium necroappetens]